MTDDPVRFVDRHSDQTLDVVAQSHAPAEGLADQGDGDGHREEERSGDGLTETLRLKASRSRRSKVNRRCFAGPDVLVPIGLP